MNESSETDAEQRMTTHERVVGFIGRHPRTVGACFFGPLVVAILVFLYADFRFAPDRASAWFTGIGVWLAILAFLAAAIAALFTYPPYRDLVAEQAKRPKLRIDFEVSVGLDMTAPFLPVAKGAPFDISGAKFVVRVIVVNAGSGTLRGARMNIALPAACRITVADDPRVPHFLLPGNLLNDQVVPGTATRVVATVVERDFPPGHFVFHVSVRAALNQDCPVAVAVTGEPQTMARIELRPA